MIRTAFQWLLSWGAIMMPATLLAIDPPKPGSIRIATFNMALNRKSDGELRKGLEAGDSQAKKIAAIVQWVSPDVLLANEVDFDGGNAATVLREQYLNNEAILQRQDKPWRPYAYQFAAPVNTGVSSSLDINGDGEVSGPEDAWGYGVFPGQYGMVIYSRYPIHQEQAKTYQKFLWKDLPQALRPGTGDRR
jgi:hypothetical protein